MVNDVASEGAKEGASEGVEEGREAFAAACELLALSFRYPTPELVAVVSSGEWAEAAREIATALGLALPAGWDAGADACAGSDPETLLHVLRVETTRLFVGAPEPVVSPYEGVWRAADDGVQPLLFVNPHSMDVERFMRSCGIGRIEGTNEPLDHVATELEFVQWLSVVARDGVPAPGGVEAPDGGWAGAADRFLSEHVQTWMPRFARKAVAESREPFYRSAAMLLEAFVR
ncbi:molecular chaperone TorD family protein [Eggerthella guodeyinii]|uniref:Molecular chaperone TorD family protein n=1 Tax=Eggerthella guodeyinii TaxID=2690837 RepID=A0A6L7IT37_9ACTN|nr:molecular chaperone TorD family protein [Eggerthella guodeyinii]QOS67511.1 molecular chaperone TorD family protein [Eggerthella guodeyinii]